MSNNADRAVLVRLALILQSFEDASIDIEYLQSTLQQAVALLGQESSATARAIYLAEADVEEIQFTRLLNEQREAVRRRMSALSPVIMSAIGGPETEG